MVGATTKKHHQVNATNIYKFHLFHLMYWVTLLIPAVYVLALIFRKLLPKCVVQKMKRIVQMIRHNEDNVSDPWPARLDDTDGEYTPLLSAAQ